MGDQNWACCKTCGDGILLIIAGGVTKKLQSLQTRWLKFFGCLIYDNQKFFVAKLVASKKNSLPIMRPSKIFFPHMISDRMLSTTTSFMIKSSLLPIVWRLNFFWSPYVCGSRSSNWWWIDFHHWFSDRIEYTW